MELSTGLGLLLAFAALLIAVILEGGTPLALLDLPAALIVFGGTLAATMVSFPFRQLVLLPGLIAQTFRSYNLNAEELIGLFVQLADQARREGLLSLEDVASNIEDAFIRKGVMLVVDGVDPAQVRDILEIDTARTAQRHKEGYGMLESMGALAPTLGIIGAVLGLINVLSRLSEPEDLGHGIAVAFVATLYGVASANLGWIPLASKLKMKSNREKLGRELAIEGILSVQAGDNPRIVREKLEAFLAPALREGSQKAEKKDL